MDGSERYDVVIAGGGLAGLCLSLQLARTLPGLRVLVAERSSHPPPEAAHKVGESSVEVASHYFTHALGLGDVLARETPKFGLRFFMSHGDNRDIGLRPECGPSHFLSVPSFQIDRGRFENALGQQVQKLGVDLVAGCRVTSVELGAGGADHRVRLEESGPPFEVRCRWLVDASGRPGLLKRQLGLECPNRHDADAVWFRLDRPIDPDEWCDDAAWSARVEHPRRLSTNHLMGTGYWVWLIPLSGGRTSVGIVTDARLHAFSALNSFEKAQTWLERHEPQCAAAVRAHADSLMDFRALRDYSHDARQLFSSDRWCLIGDAGLFLDPLYSPGSDFIAMANGLVCDLVARDRRGEDVARLAETHDLMFRALARTYLRTYLRQYPLMGNERVMVTKILWDFAMYWGGVAQLFFRDRLTDPDFMERVRPTLQRFAVANVGMQAFFREWARSEPPASLPAGSFVDYSELPFLKRLNRELLSDCDDAELLTRLASNLELNARLEQEIRRGAGGGGRAATAHLATVLAKTTRPRARR